MFGPCPILYCRILGQNILLLKFIVSVKWPISAWIYSDTNWLEITAEKKLSEDIHLTKEFVLSFELKVKFFSISLTGQTHIIQFIDEKREEILGVSLENKNRIVMTYRIG